VRVLEEEDLGTDKESLFASAAGSKALVKTKEGELRFATVGKEGVQEVEGSRGKAVGADGTIAVRKGAAPEDPDDPYSFVVAVDGVTDATSMRVNTEAESSNAIQRELNVRNDNSPPHPRREKFPYFLPLPSIPSSLEFTGSHS
jgi:hypothetical protein